MESTTLKELFDLIEEKFNYTFLIRNNDINLNERISIDMSNRSVEEILTTALKNQHADFVVNKLNEKKIPYFRLNCDNILKEAVKISIDTQAALEAKINEIDYFDVVYIDYEMENMTAFEFFKETQMSKYIRIIITKYDHIVYKSIDYDIFDFIRKKKLKEDIHNKMNRLLKKLESDHDRIIVESGNRIVAIYYDDIQYIHTDKNYIVIHGREEYKIRSTFKDFIKKIKKNDFITISYGILVNMRYVQYINLKEMMVVLENEIQLPLSYKYKNSVKEAYQEYKIR